MKRAVNTPVLVDVEMARLAYITGDFTQFRPWVLAHAAGLALTPNGKFNGNLPRADVEAAWQTAGIAKDKHQVNRILKAGTPKFWTYDKHTKRLYLTGIQKLSKRLTADTIAAGMGDTLTNKPGNKHRLYVDMSGDIGDAIARVYAAWIASKHDGEGVQIARETLCRLWHTSVPTLLKWEAIGLIGKTANYAQSNDTRVDNVPAHTYLTKNRDGTTAAAYRLPNTYHNRARIKKHDRIGKQRKVRQSVNLEIESHKQGSSISDAARPALGHLYFEDTDKHSAFDGAERYIRRLARRDGDVFRKRYFRVGGRWGVTIYEPFNIETNEQETDIAQRDIRQEHKDANFMCLRRWHRMECEAV